LPVDEDNNAPADQDKKIEQQKEDQQLHKGIEVLENRKPA
jgi:hypothetical protein